MPVYVSDRLTATLGVVRGSPTPTRLIQWFRGSTVISGANAATYTITSDDLGQPISVRQTESNYFGSAVATSAATEDVEVFDPSILFSASEPGVWFDPTDAANLDWRRNLLLYSGQFDNAVWAKVGATTPTANTVTAAATTDRHRISQVITAPTTATTFWVEATAGTHSFIQLYNTAAAGYFANFDLTLGVVGTVGALSTASIVPLGSGRFRCIVTFDASTPLSTTFPVGLVTSASAAFNESWAAAGTETVSLFLAQLELGSVATTYQPITNLNDQVITRFPNATLYQDATGAVPVYAPEQPVGLMLDKSKGLALGAELVTNGDFSSGTDWNFNLSGASISGGKLTFSAAPDNAGPYQTKAGFTGGIYSVTVVVDSISSGAITATLGIGSPTPSTAFVMVAAGTYTFICGNLSGIDPYLRVYAEGTSTTAVVDSVSVKQLLGNHATQTTAISRPLYGIVPVSGRRNLLTYSEDFYAIVWPLFGGASKTGVNIAVAPDGTTTADGIRLTTAGTGSNVYQQPTYTVAAVPYTFSCWVKRNAASDQTFQLFNNFQGAQSSSGNLIATDTWQRFSHTSTSNSGTANMLVGIIGNTSGTQADVLVWGAQLELGSTATAYQKVTNDYDVTEAGVASVGYLRFDGTNSFMVTPTITPGTDKVQMFAGVRKLSDAIRIIAETSENSDVFSGTVILANYTTNTYFWRSRGTGGGTALPANGTYVSPITNVLTGIGDISGDTSTFRVNGTQVAQSTADQGTGNYLAYPLSIGFRSSGATLYFNGQLFPMIVRFGPNMSSALIRTTENWVASKTAGVVLP